MDIVEKIRNLQLHDVALDMVAFNWASSSITIKYLAYQDDTNDYYTKSIEFTQTSEVIFNCNSIFSIREITSVAVNMVADGYHAKIIFLTDLGGPSYELIFNFKTLE
jgi:hypothetical protein